MKYRYSYFHSALQLLIGYEYPTPFHLYLKSFFRKNKKYGSKDRKIIQNICYDYFRLGLAVNEFPIEVCLNKVMDYYETNEIDFSFEEPIYFKEKLSENFSHFNTSKLFNYRPLSWLKNYNVDHEELSKFTTTDLLDDAFGNKQINLLSAPKHFQIQDLSSQFICSQIALKEGEKFWDVCAASGGKSINLTKRNPNVDFYLSDIRSQILQNARNRFALYQLLMPKMTVFDAIENENLIFNKNVIPDLFFDVILIDAPCTGSGTWFRNPEHFSNFDYDNIQFWNDRQCLILKNTLKFLKPGGTIYYVTCSVFEKENEDVVTYAKEILKLEEINRIYFDGIKHQSDSMFLTAFKK